LAPSSIKKLLRALKTGIEATAIGVFDAQEGEIHACSEARHATFWEAFEGWRCMNADWGDWDRVLLTEKRARVVCGCGAHALEAFVIHERWILLLLADRALVPGAAGVVTHALRLLGGLLPAPHYGSSPAVRLVH
jgi:hypothetical protein